MTRVVSLFTGVAGLDLAVEHVTGGAVVAHAEVDPTACKILDHHYPDTPNLGDATTINWTPWQGRVDAVCAGFSCQDISQAGAGKGITDDTRSGVTWGATIRAVRALRPRHVYLENVSAILVRGLDVVAADLAAAGYDFRWTCVRASDVGAPHRRDRWFAVAYPDGGGVAGEQPWRAAANGDRPAVAYPEGEQVGGTGLARQRAGRVVADAGRDGEQRRGRPGQLARPPRADTGDVGRGERVRDAAGDRRTPPPDTADIGQQRGGRPRRRRTRPPHNGHASPAHTARVGRAEGRPQPDRRQPPTVPQPAWGDYGPAITRWATTLGRPAPPPTDPAGRLNPDFVEWMVGLPQGWTDIPDVTRTGRLRCLGNIAVPQQAAAAYRMLLS